MFQCWLIQLETATLLGALETRTDTATHHRLEGFDHPPYVGRAVLPLRFRSYRVLSIFCPANFQPRPGDQLGVDSFHMCALGVCKSVIELGDGTTPQGLQNRKLPGLSSMFTAKIASRSSPTSARSEMCRRRQRTLAPLTIATADLISSACAR